MKTYNIVVATAESKLQKIVVRASSMSAVETKYPGILKIEIASDDIPAAHKVWQRMNSHEKGDLMDKVGYKGSIAKTHKACIDYINKNMSQYKHHLLD